MRVNAYWLSQFLWATGWHIDADDHPLNRLNMQNATSRAILCEDYLIPGLQELSVTQHRLVKETLRYALNFFSEKEWERYTEDELPDITHSPREMFADVWGMLFPGEPWHLESDDDYFRLDDQDDALFLDRYRYGRS